MTRRTALWRSILGSASLLTAAAVLAGCSSSASSSPGTAAVRGQCEQVAAVLGDGPDPIADPVGHAEAQIQPLRELHLTDASLRKDVDALANAYQRYYEVDGAGTGVGKAVAAAGHRVNVICPGAVS